MSFVQFHLYNDLNNVVQLQVRDCVDPNNRTIILSPDYLNSPFPLVANGTTTVLSATALVEGGPDASVDWNAQPGAIQPPTNVTSGKTYNLSNGFEK